MMESVAVGGEEMRFRQGMGDFRAVAGGVENRGENPQEGCQSNAHVQ